MLGANTVLTLGGALARGVSRFVPADMDFLLREMESTLASFEDTSLKGDMGLGGASGNGVGSLGVGDLRADFKAGFCVGLFSFS
jgi:hypothetical protein